MMPQVPIVGDRVRFKVEADIERVRKALGYISDEGVIMFVGVKDEQGRKQILVRLDGQVRNEACFLDWFEVLEEEEHEQ